MNKMREYERGREDGLDLARRIVKEETLYFLLMQIIKCQMTQNQHCVTVPKDFQKHQKFIRI